MALPHSWALESPEYILYMAKYVLPQWLGERCDQARYDLWLARKAASHCKRDRLRGNLTATVETYKRAIHKAVTESNGKDHYTGDVLRWDLLSTYENEKSRSGKRDYKHAYALLPTVDHVSDGSGTANFRVCSWRTNDSKHDLSHEEFVQLCRRVVLHHDSAVSAQSTLTSVPGYQNPIR